MCRYASSLPAIGSGATGMAIEKPLVGAFAARTNGVRAALRAGLRGAAALPESAVAAAVAGAGVAAAFRVRARADGWVSTGFAPLRGAVFAAGLR